MLKEAMFYEKTNNNYVVCNLWYFSAYQFKEESTTVERVLKTNGKCQSCGLNMK